MKSDDILQKYYAQIGKVSDADKIDAAAEYAGLPPAKIKKSPGLLMNLLDALDRPGNATRALLVGKLGGLKGLIPFAQSIEDLTGWDIALNPDERVTGEEVLEKYTGIKDKKGKFDTADVLGFLIEVVADPLWLVGGVGGLTKTGKAASVVKATHKSAKALGSSDDLIRAMSKAGWADDAIQKTVKNTITKDTLKSIHKHFRLGTPLPENVNKKIIKSFSTLYEGGKLPKGIFKAKSWAEQAAAGERALLHLGLPGMKRPVVKGVGALDKLDTIATKIRMGWVGEKFLHTTKRVSTAKQKAFYDTTKGMTDQGKYFTQNAFGQIDVIGKNLDEKMLADLMPHMEYVGGVRKATEKLDMLDMIKGMDDLQGDDLVAALKYVGVDAGDIKNLTKPEIVKKYTAIFKSNKKEMQQNLNVLLEGYDSIKADTLLQASDEYADMFKNILDTEVARGLPSPSLKGKFGYAPRQYTKKFLKWRKRKGTINFEHQGKMFSVQHGSQISRTPGLRDMTRFELGDFFAKKGFKGNMFEHPQAAIAERMAKGYKATGAANAIYESIDQFGKTNGGDGMSSISKMLKELRLNPKGDVLKRIGSKEFIDDDIASALTNQFKFAQKDTVETAINKITKMYKTMLTVPFTAFHTRNFMTATTMNFMDGVVNPRFYKKATQLQIAASKTRHLARKEGISFIDASKKVKWPKVKTAGGTLDGAVFYNQLEQNRLVGEVAGHFAVADELNLGGKFSKKTAGRKHGAKERMFAASMAFENNPRIANVLAHAEGMPIDEAIRNSKRVHFDYSDLSEAEKGLRDNVVLFWTFARKNLAAQTKYLYQKPAKMAMFSKLAGGTPGAERRYNLPKYMQERIDIPTPFEDEEGRTINVRGLGLPMEEAFGSISAPGAGIFDRMSRLVSRQAAKTIPTIKTPIEIAAKKNLYFDKDIRDVGEFVEQALPTSRFTNTIKRFGRDDQPETKALDLVSGVKVTPAYDDFYKYLSEKEVLENQMKQSPRFKSFTRYYPADKEAVTPGDKALLKRLYGR